MAERGLVLSYQDSLALLVEVDQWCERTGTNYNRLIVAAEVGVSTRSLVRNQGKCMSLRVAGRLRYAMKKYRRGISREQHRERIAAAQEVRVEDVGGAAEPLRVSRDPCPRCGARGDVDCGHGPVRDNWLRSR